MKARTRAAIILGSLTSLVVVGCSDGRPPPGQARTVTVTGTGEAQAAPDQAEVSAGVQTVGDTVVAASRENKAVVSRIMDALTDQGIDLEDVGTTNYSIWAEQNYNEQDKQRVTGYHVSNIVVVTIKDISRVGEILAAVTNAGANSINGIQFSVSDTDALENQAREKAMADARRRAEALTSLAGVELGEVVTLSTDTLPDYGGPMMARRAMESFDAQAPAPTITPGQHKVGVQISVTYAIR